MKRSLIVGIVIIFIAAGAIITLTKATALSWGGPFQTVIPCWNEGVIWTVVGPPRPGVFIWTASTKTYDYGPPSRPGQYGLGLAGPPYFCVVSPYPVIVLPGIIMTMVGTSR